MKAIKTLLICGTATAALAACDRIGSPLEALSGGAPPPDEFRVTTRKPLNMPNNTNLPEPRLGERSPLELDPYGDARTALTGTPNDASGAGSSGESALVAAATASSTRGESGTALEASEAELTRNKPYDAPTVLELLNLDGEKAENVLDPNAESRRLRTTGVAPAPVDPDDKPTVDPDAAKEGYISPGEEYSPKFPYGNQKKGSS